MSPEVWRPVDGTDGRYEVSDQGRIRGPRSVGPGSVGTKGYFQACIDRKTRNVHALVAEAFIGPRPEGLQVLHGDDDKSNNRLSNLSYGTPGQNMQDALANGRIQATKRTKCPLGHLLAEPNLMPSQLARGWRSCLACSRGKAYAVSQGTKKHESLSHGYYREIMEIENHSPRKLESSRRSAGSGGVDEADE